MGRGYLCNSCGDLMQLFGLLDCNNFYVSCERVFNPKLRNKPVVVLSNNDGCIVARSNEAKALGIPMGAPYFKWKPLLTKHHAVVCSSNYALYGDMSARVMQCIIQMVPDVQIYSIDEAFLLFKHTDLDKAVAQAQQLRATIAQWTGIPVSIGIAPTKTLAKVANKYAKKYAQLNGVFGAAEPTQINWLLEHMHVSDIWGIGRRYSKKLAQAGIHTALQLKDADDAFVRKQCTIIGLKTVWELRGFACFPLDCSIEPQKGIACTRSFSSAITTLAELKQAIATYAAQAAEKARDQRSAVGALHVFIHTSRFNDGYYGNGTTIQFAQPTAYTPDLISYAHQALYRIYRPGYAYKRAGVIFMELHDTYNEQLLCFQETETSRTKKQSIMHAVDTINAKWGRHTTQFAAQGIKRTWSSKRIMQSARYTTCWRELLKVKCTH